MTNVLGFPLDRAITCLRNDGFEVETREVRSKKGVQSADSLRVVRQTAGQGCVLLLYAAFQTAISD